MRPSYASRPDYPINFGGLTKIRSAASLDSSGAESKIRGASLRFGRPSLDSSLTRESKDKEDQREKSG